MTKSLSITEARQQLTTLANNIRPDETVIVTQRGKSSLAILPFDLYDSIVETLDILSDPDALIALRQGAKEIREGMGVPWDNIRVEPQ